MGRQINFYFAIEDERIFLELTFLKNVKYLSSLLLNKSNFEIYTDLHLEPYIEASSAQAYICLKLDVNKINMRRLDNEDKYYINSTSSPVIEYTRSGPNKKGDTLISGRLWFEMKYWGKDENGESVLLSKSKELEKLYNSLAGWIRRYCKRLPNGNYIGPHAMKLYEKGAELSP